MAYIRLTENGKYEVHVARKGQRRSKTCDTKAQATMWANETEIELMGGKKAAANKTFGDLMARYKKEHKSKNEESYKAAQFKIARILTEPLMKVKLKDLEPIHFATWRDQRLAEGMMTSTVRRDIVIMSAALKLAIKEWKWLDSSPLKEITKPVPPPGRKRLISREEIDRLIEVMGYKRDSKPVTQMQRTGAVFLLAIETAMRDGEIAGLTMDRVFLNRRVVHLRACDTKTNEARDVPLSTEAVRIIKQMEVAEGSVFRLTANKISHLFIDAYKLAGITGLTFHDSRHEAITRLAKTKKLSVLELATAVGHKNLNQLLTYYNESADDVAKKLD